MNATAIEPPIARPNFLMTHLANLADISRREVVFHMTDVFVRQSVAYINSMNVLSGRSSVSLRVCSAIVT
jgi:hypothetical protein